MICPVHGGVLSRARNASDGVATGTQKMRFEVACAGWSTGASRDISLVTRRFSSPSPFLYECQRPLIFGRPATTPTASQDRSNSIRQLLVIPVPPCRLCLRPIRIRCLRRSMESRFAPQSAARSNSAPASINSGRSVSLSCAKANVLRPHRPSIMPAKRMTRSSRSARTRNTRGF